MNEAMQSAGLRLRSLGLSSRLPDLVISDGALESLKWLALVAMTCDHFNHILFKLQLPVISEFGRIAMPLFGLVLAYNLARPYTLQKGIHMRAMARMAFFGLIATPFYCIAFEKPSWFLLNILFTLMLATGIIYLIEKGGFYCELLAIALFILGGIFVDYIWFGLGYCLAGWYYCKKPCVWRLLLWIGSITGLYFANDNLWALVALPVIFMATKVDYKMPRLRLAFYIYYPLHLAVLLAIKKWVMV
ncbi:MAG: TraX family protein [Methylotenera sp.]